MFLKRMVPAAGVALALGVAACGGDDSSEFRREVHSEQAGEVAGFHGSGQDRVSVPAADHGWLKAVADDAKKAVKSSRA